MPFDGNEQSNIQYKEMILYINSEQCIYAKVRLFGQVFMPQVLLKATNTLLFLLSNISTKG